jgi:predicted nucleic acid-binding Zn ribbon protein
MSTYELQHTFTKPGYGTRDVKLGCMRCGSFAAGSPMCDECTGEIMKDVGARRWRMQLIFYSIIFMGIVAYYYVL